jgi:hypothetical protein
VDAAGEADRIAHVLEARKLLRRFRHRARHYAELSIGVVF